MKAHILAMSRRLAWLKTFFSIDIYEQDKYLILTRLFELFTLLIDNKIDNNSLVLAELIDWCFELNETGQIKPDSYMDLAIGLYEILMSLAEELKYVLIENGETNVVFKDFTSIDIIVLI